MSSLYETVMDECNKRQIHIAPCDKVMFLQDNNGVVISIMPREENFKKIENESR